MAFNTYSWIQGISRWSASFWNSYARDPLIDLDERLSEIFRRDNADDSVGIGKMVQKTTAERDAIVAPIAGMSIWNTTTSQAEDYNGSSWIKAGGGAVLWDDLSTSDSVPIGQLLKTDGLEGFSLTTLNDELIAGEFDTDKTWHPDGAGGAEWRVPVHAHAKTWDTPGDHDWDLPNTANWVAFMTMGGGGGGGSGRSSQTAQNGVHPGPGGGGGARGQFKSKSEAAYASKRHFRIHVGAGGGTDTSGQTTWIKVRRPSNGTLADTVLSSVGGAKGNQGGSASGGSPGSTYDSLGGRGSSTEAQGATAGDDAGGGGGGGFYWHHPGVFDSAAFVPRAHAGASGGGAYTYLTGISRGTGAAGGGIGGTTNGNDGSDALASGNFFGEGGGGGGGSESASGGLGGDGIHGSGGGGGGGASYTRNGAGGGSGGDGVVRIVWW